MDFLEGFARMCQDGWEAGYHERNGGNASYRMSAAEVQAMVPRFREEPGPWEPLDANAPEMAKEFLLVTGSGKYLRNVQGDLEGNAGIVEIDDAGGAWRVVWGLGGGARPTSEIAAHVLAHGVRSQVTGGTDRVLYHAHPTALVALTALVPADARDLTRLLWTSLTESVIAFPGGVGALPWKVPGSAELAATTAEVLRGFDACVWQMHGVFASGDSFDAAFGLVGALDKAADVYLRARAAQGGAAILPHALTDDDLRSTAVAYGLAINESFLD